MKILTYQSYFYTPPRPAIGIQGNPWFESGTDGANTRPPSKTTVGRYAAASGKSQFASFNLANFNWENQPPQPPHPRPERTAAILAGDPGTQVKFVPPVISITAWGYEEQTRLPAKLWQKAAAASGKSQFASFNLANFNWENQPPQPPHPRTEKAGAVLIGDTGTEAQYVFVPPVTFTPWGYEPNLFQNKFVLRNALDVGDQGTENRLNPKVAWGYEPTLSQTRITPRNILDIGDQGTENRFTQKLNPVWEITFPNLFRTRVERFGALAYGDNGTAAKFIAPISSLTAWGYEDQNRLPGKFWQKGAAASGKSQFASFNLANFNWENQAFQPPHPRVEKFGCIAAGDQGNEAVYVFVPPSTLKAWGYDTQAVFPYKINRLSATKGRTDFAIFALRSWWETQPEELRQPPTYRAAAILAGDSGTEAKYVFVPVVPLTAWGYDIQPNFSRRVDRGAAVFGKSQFASFNLANFNWENQAFQPPHLRPERAAAFLIGDPGNEAKYVFVPPVPLTAWGYDIQPNFSRRVDRGAAVFGKSQFASFNLANFNWENQALQPPHLRVERAAAILAGDTGTEAKYVFVPVVPLTAWGYDGPPHNYIRPKRINATKGRTDFAIFSLRPWWLTQFEQLRVPPTYRGGAIALGDPGNEAVYVFVPPPPLVSMGWEIASPLLSAQVRKQSRGAGLYGKSQFATFNLASFGWPVPLFQPGHPTFQRAGGIMVGDNGTENIYHFVPPPGGAEHHNLPFLATMGKIRSF